jgi:hypothetical protein
MRVYFDGADALVTERLFLWRLNWPRACEITELRDIRRVRRDTASRKANLFLAAVAAAALIVAPGWLLLHRMPGWLVLLGAAAAAVTLATIQRRSVQQWELRAAYRGHGVILFRSLAMESFDKVTRALRRAVEASRPSANQIDPRAWLTLPTDTAS